ncbi:helix-hairpin-helix domain-containing protein [Acinetobacter sp. 197]|uniref:helix-hairpin-helix domain-containing protein n=1 Tax=Acinetobacter sp. 197 TaxID=3114696 RepID=UPI003A8B674E
MNANQLYEKLQTIGIPIIYVDSVESSMNMNFPLEELDKHIEILEPKFLLVESLDLREQLNLESNDTNLLKEFFKENKRYINKYISENIDEKSKLAEINKKTVDDKGMITIGFNLNGCIISISCIDDWMISMSKILKYISDTKEEEENENQEIDNTNYFNMIRQEQEKIRKERENLQKEKDDMIEKVEKLTNCDSFKELKTTTEMLLFWEKNIPEIYKTLSRSFMEKMAKKYAAIKRVFDTNQKNIQCLLLIEGLNVNTAEILVNNGINSIQDVADCSSSEIEKFLINKKTADNIIMGARKYLGIV